MDRTAATIGTIGAHCFAWYCLGRAASIAEAYCAGLGENPQEAIEWLKKAANANAAISYPDAVKNISAEISAIVTRISARLALEEELKGL